MSSEFITPITMSSLSADFKSTAKTEAGTEGLFKSILSDTISSVQETENDLANQQYLLATGQIDDAHTVQIAASKAQLSVEMLVQVRNKAVEAYNELMKISM